MRAETTWDVWRRILQEPDLQTTLQNGRLDESLKETGFTGEEIEVARYYQTHFKDAAWFVTSYRFRLVSAFVNAVELGAPFTHRVLLAHGYNIRDMAETYYDDTGWIDDGPYVYRLCSKILDWLPESRIGEAILPLACVVVLEAAAIVVLRDAADIAPSVWATPIPKKGELLAAIDSGRVPVWTGRARVVETGYNIAPLFSVKGATTVPMLDLPQETCYFAAYLPNPENKHRFARISLVDFNVAREIAQGTATPNFIRSNIGSCVKFAKIRAVGLSA